MANEKVSAKLRFEIFKRDNFTCQYCGKKSPEVILEVDHIIPIAEGGKNNQENLITACFYCNRGKGARLLDTILKDKNLRDETIMMAEREMQLKEYNHVLEERRNRENAEINFLLDQYCDFFPQKGYAADAFERAVPTIRLALKVMSYIEILEFMEYAVFRTGQDTRGDYHNNAAAKYLCGILRNKIKDSKNVD